MLAQAPPVQTHKTLPQYGGSWSRTRNDTGALAREIQQSTAPIKFTLDPVKVEQCQQCRPSDSGWIGKQGNSYDSSKPAIDVDSELRQLNRILSRDPNMKYIPYCPQCGSCTQGVGGDSNILCCPQCQPQLTNFEPCPNRVEYTRISNPSCTLKETGVNRFQPICLNPQEPTRWEFQQPVNLNNRLFCRDNFVPCIPVPMSQNSVWPQGE
jgi:hypothetical protein